MEIPREIQDWESTPHEDCEGGLPPYFLWWDEGVIRLSPVGGDLHQSVGLDCRRDIDELVVRLMKAKVELPVT